MRPLSILLLVVAIAFAASDATAQDSARDILVTFENHGASATGSSFSAPYRNRKRYSIAAEARRNARAIEQEYMLTQVDHWPIRSLSIYCFVYRVATNQSRDEIIDRLKLDDRVESAQPLQRFSTQTGNPSNYNDQYAGLQHGLDTLSVSSAHRYSRGQGIRIAVIDSSVDAEHEDLQDRVKKVALFAPKNRTNDKQHGTAVASVIGAATNNRIGIVGVAPEASIELSVACWAGEDDSAICDSFTLAKALDELLKRPPHILNLSLAGPYDPLLARLLAKALEQDVIVVAADPETGRGSNFPATLDGIIAVGSSTDATSQGSDSIFAPGQQIMVAIPGNNYDFRSGSSLAAAHISGVIALLLSSSPEETSASVSSLLRQSQRMTASERVSVDACMVLFLAVGEGDCPRDKPAKQVLELKPGA